MTYKWFKKNDPDYLKQIEEKSDDLRMFHDFRKLFEGFHDEQLQIYESKFYEKHKDIKELQKKMDAAYDAYVKECKIATESLVGEYGHTRLSRYGKNGVNISLNNTIEDLVQEVIEKKYPAHGW